MRNKLIELIQESVDGCAEYWAGRIADHLITNGVYNAHEVACILAEATGDDCACNVNGNDEWLAFCCELQDVCPHTVGVACWEQYLKHLDKKTKGV